MVDNETSTGLPETGSGVEETETGNSTANSIPEKLPDDHPVMRTLEALRADNRKLTEAHKAELAELTRKHEAETATLRSQVESEKLNSVLAKVQAECGASDEQAEMFLRDSTVEGIRAKGKAFAELAIKPKGSALLGREPETAGFDTKTFDGLVNQYLNR